MVKMKKFHLLVLVLILALIILACGAGDSKKTEEEAASEPEQAEVAEQQEVEGPAVESEPEEPAEQAAPKVETDFPLLADAENVLDMQGVIVYQSKTSLEDAFAFYRKELSGMGLKEREILTLDEEDMFQFVFDGSPNGKQLVVQTLQLDEKTINVTIRYEEPSK
jgi:hypothetical protein